jgi:short-subunit dehydrogenase
MPRPIREQTVVITGASSGIGRCTARHMARGGAAVVLTGRREWALAELAREIEAQNGRALAIAGDVTREADMAAVARATVERFGRIDTWINGAAVYIQGRVTGITLEEYRRIFEVNLLGVINGTQQALRYMLPQGSGVIIQVSSIVAERAAAYTSAYACSKRGLDGFTEALRSELWGSGVRVATVYLPAVDTPIYHHARAKMGTIPKPAPPVHDPIEAARLLAEVAETGKISSYLGWFRHFYLAAERVSAGLADWFLQHTAGFTLTDIPANGDNLYSPSERPPTERAGWARQGVRGFTLRETVRVLPVESMVGAAAVGFLAGRAATRLLRR